MIPKHENYQKKAQNFSCDFCAFTTQRKDKWEQHLLTLKHKSVLLNTETTKKGGENINNIFQCKKCNYNTLCKNNWKKHVLTLKHNSPLNTTNCPKEGEKFGCRYCNQKYSSLRGLMVHQNKCAVYKSDIVLIEQNVKLMKTTQDLVENNKELMESNKELTTRIIEICSTMKPSIITTNNNTFNLNCFLNETCKNAMSLQDFVSSIQLQLSDLEETGRLGFSGGISNIITNSLNKMETEDRPMHCTDSKRETIYIKNDTEWQKDENNEQLTSAIKQIARKNSQNILPWRELNPDCCNSSSRKNDQYLKIVGNAMAGGDQAEIKRNIDKIVSNVAKEIVVDKQKIINAHF